MLLARCFDPKSMAVAERLLDVPDEAAARALLAGDGMALLSCRPAEHARRRAQAPVAVFCRELRSLVGAGLSVVEALEALSEASSRQAEGAGLHDALLQRLKTGRSLSAAMGDVGGFPQLLVASVRASERTSNLPQALDAYLQFDDAVTRLGRRVVSAALYPAIVAALGVVIGIFLLWVVLPRFAALYAQMGHGAGGITHALVAASRVLRDAPWLMPVALGSLAALALWLRDRQRWRSLLGWSTRHLPWLRRAWRDFELARQFEALALLVRGGYSVPEGLTLCSSLGGSAAGHDGLEHARRAVESGQSVSRAFAAAGMTDAVTERLLRAGERGGDFAAVLQAIAARHAAAFETFVERATRLVEPLLLLVVALVIGGMVIMLYMPIFDIASSVR
jgi:general secretion pathway protein F